MPELKRKTIQKLLPNMDPSMEQATERLIQMVSHARDAGQKSKTEQTEALEELSRFLRASKVLLRECMESYASYHDYFESFVEHSLEGCSLAEQFGASKSLRLSLNRHAEEIESLRTSYKELRANNGSDDSVGELYEGAKVTKKSRAKASKIAVS